MFPNYVSLKQFDSEKVRITPQIDALGFSADVNLEKRVNSLVQTGTISIHVNTCPPMSLNPPKRRV